MGKIGRLSREERRKLKRARKAQHTNQTRAQVNETWQTNFARAAEWRVFFDGATGPTNPGESGFGAVLYRNGLEVDAQSQKIGFATSNQAEYAGLIAALELALRHGADELVVCGDSQLILQQVFGHYRVHTPHLVPPRDRARELVGKFRAVYAAWIPREQNTRADELSKVGIPELSHRNSASESDLREMRRCVKVILESPQIIRSREMAFVMKMDSQLDTPRANISPKQWKWLQDIEERLHEDAFTLARTKLKQSRSMKPRLIKAT